jgi:septum formation protein
VVYCDDTIFNKPTDVDNAKFMLRQYSNKTHKVITGFCLIVDNKVYSYSSITKVTCSNISEDEINKYLKENDIYDKSGAYAIQSAFSCFVKSISGEFFNIMGLPLNLVATKIKEIVPSILN